MEFLHLLIGTRKSDYTGWNYNWNFEQARKYLLILTRVHICKQIRLDCWDYCQAVHWISTGHFDSFWGTPKEMFENVSMYLRIATYSQFLVCFSTHFCRSWLSRSWSIFFLKLLCSFLKKQTNIVLDIVRNKKLELWWIFSLCNTYLYHVEFFRLSEINYFQYLAIRKLMNRVI